MTAPDSERTKQLLATTSNPPTEDEIVAIMASRIADQVDFDLLNEIPMKLARDNPALLVLDPKHINLSFEGPMDISPNGCTCRFLHPGQICISCRGRAKSEQKCRKCNVGLFEGDETARHQCSNCYYDENPDAP